MKGSEGFSASSWALMNLLILSTYRADVTRNELWGTGHRMLFRTPAKGRFG